MNTHRWRGDPAGTRPAGFIKRLMWAWLLLGLVAMTLPTADASDGIPAVAVEIRDNELTGVQALATFLYSTPMGASMRKCVAGAEATGNTEIQAERQKIDGLPTKSRQQEMERELAEKSEALPSMARANCMVIAMMYLEYVDSDITVPTSNDTSDSTVHNKLVPDRIASLAGDLTAAALRDLAFLLEHFQGQDAIKYCGPWLSGAEFRKYVLNDSTCRDWLMRSASVGDGSAAATWAAALQDAFKAVYLDSLPKMWYARVQIFLTSWDLCARGEEARKGVLRGLDTKKQEEIWKRSCRVRAMVGYSLSDVVKPDFSEVPSTEAVRAATAIVTVTPPTQAYDARALASALNSCMPKWSRLLNEAGRVVVAIEIDTTGKAKLVRVVESSGFERLDGASACVVDKLRFNPATRNGQPVVSEATLPFTVSYP